MHDAQTSDIRECLSATDEDIGLSRFEPHQARYNPQYRAVTTSSRHKHMPATGIIHLQAMCHDRRTRGAPKFPSAAGVVYVTVSNKYVGEL